MTTNSIYLRPGLDYDPKQTGRNNLVAFSPDILPLYQTKIKEVDQLTSTYNTFVAQTLAPEENNLLYVRGAAHNSKVKASAKVNLFNVTNELILWPQVLKTAQSIGTISLEYDPADGDTANTGVTASTTSLQFKPTNRGGRHDALVAAIDQSLDDLPDASNYRDLLTTVGAPDTLALYNSVVADPIFDVYTFSTRLRFYDDGSTPVSVELDLEALGMPDGYDVSIFSDNPSIILARTPITSDARLGLTINVQNGLDALISVQIYKNDGAKIPAEYASISLVAYVLEKNHHITTTVVLGAEHVLFDSSIRIARRIVQRNLLGETAQGFYFRDQIGDTATLPRTGSASHSPDIQPLGTKADSNIANTLSSSTFNTDVTDQRGVDILTGSANYVYLRGATTSPVHIETSLYAIPNAILISPQMYGPHAIMDVDENNNVVQAIRELVTTQSGPATVDTPFNWVNPLPVKQVDPNSDHYCLIAEARNWTEDPLDKDLWPHQIGIPTGSDFTMWVLDTPTVAWRNVGLDYNPDAPSLIWETNMTIPDGYPANTRWTLKVACSNIPPGGFFSMSSTGPPGVNLGKTPISNPNESAGVDFTGVTGPYSATVTVSWWQGTGAPRPTGSTISAVLQINTNKASALAQLTSVAHERHPSTHNWPLVVGPDYPNLVETPHGRKGKKKRLLGHAHPIPALQRAGRYETPPRVMARPERAVALGADGKRAFRLT